MPPQPDSTRAVRSIESLKRSSAFRLLVVTSSALRRYFEQEHGFPAERAHIAPNGASEPHAASTTGSPVKFPAEDRLRVGYAGPLYQGKGMELVEEIARLCERYDFHIVGGTDEDIASWRARLAGAANVYIHGRLGPGEVPAFLEYMDILVAPYQHMVHVSGSGSGSQNNAHWMSPLKIFEYMCAGKSVVASDLPVIREVLSERNACLCPPDAPEAWGRALDRLAADRELRLELGAAARADFERYYRRSSRIERILEKSTSSSRSGAEEREPTIPR